MIICPHCGKECSDDADFCRFCGKELTSSGVDGQIVCKHCGAKNSEDVDFCKMCGKRLNDTVEEVTRPQPDQTNLPRINNTPVNPSEISKKTVAIVCSICGTIAVVAIVVGAIFIFGSNKTPDNSSINQNAPAPTNDVTAEATTTPSPTPESTPEATPEATPESTSETTSDLEDENDEVDTKLWTLLEAYKEYLEEEYYNPEDEDDKVFHESEDDDEYVSVDTCYLVDIDGNGVPEMIYKETPKTIYSSVQRTKPRVYC